VDDTVVAQRMSALRKVGVPYTDEEIAGAEAEVKGKTEMEAVIAYLQVWAPHSSKGRGSWISPPCASWPRWRRWRVSWASGGGRMPAATSPFRRGSQLPFDQD
jgi:hypothetical protein